MGIIRIIRIIRIIGIVRIWLIAVWDLIVNLIKLKIVIEILLARFFMCNLIKLKIFSEIYLEFQGLYQV